MLPAALTSVWEQVSVSSCKAAYSSKVCVLEGVRKAWFPGERRVSLAWVCDSNGHQASFQAERKGTVKRGGGASQGSNENHPSISWRQWHEGEKKRVWSLDAFPELRQGVSWEGKLSKFQSLCFDLLFQLSSFTSALRKLESVNEIQLKQLDMQQILDCSNKVGANPKKNSQCMLKNG